MAQTKKNISTVKKKPDPEQIAAAIDFRLQGYSYEQIAQEMKIEAQLAMELVEAGLKVIVRDDPFQRMLIDLQRIDQLLTQVYPSAAQGDKEAINTALSLRREREVIERKFERMESFRRLAPPAEENPP